VVVDPHRVVAEALGLVGDGEAAVDAGILAVGPEVAHQRAELHGRGTYWCRTVALGSWFPEPARRRIQR
jgi:hypothetical protein